MEAKARKAEAKAYDTKKKAHFKMQTDGTKTMLKATKKKNKKMLRHFRKKKY